MIRSNQFRFEILPDICSFNLSIAFIYDFLEDGKNCVIFIGKH